MTKTAKVIMNRVDWRDIMQTHNLCYFLSCSIIVCGIILNLPTLFSIPDF